MLQRPGCFIFVVIALFIGGAAGQQYIRSITGAQPAAAQPMLTASASVEPSATVDALATTGASVAATSDVVMTQQAGTQTQAIVGTSAARTATADTWTATAAADAATLRAAEQTETGLRVAILIGTLTAIPPAQTQTEAAKWATARAQETQAKADRDFADRQRHWSSLAGEAWGAVTVALPVAIILALIVSAIVMPSAASWRVQGKAGGEAQATVEQAKRRDPIPTTTGGQPTAPIDPHTKVEHLALRVLGRMAEITGADSRTLTSAPEYGDNRSRDRVVAALVDSGWAVSENGVGVRLLSHSIGEMIEDIADGGVRLPDPPTLAA